MKHSLLKSVAAVAGVILWSNGSFAADNVWTYYAKGAEGNPAKVTCIVKSPWVLSVNSWNATTGALQFGSPTILSGEGVLDLQNVKVQTADALVPIQSFDFDRSGYFTNAVTELWVTHLKNIPTIQNNKYLRRIVYTSDLLTEMRWKAYAGCVNLTNFQARCPNLLLYKGEVFTNVPITNDINELVSPCIQGINCALPGSVTGTLKVTNQTSLVCYGGVTNLWLEGPYMGQAENGILGYYGGNDQLLRGNKTMQSLTLKWPKIHCSNVGNYFTMNATGLKELGIYLPALTNLTTEFGGIANLEKFTVYGGVMDPKILDKITVAFPARAADSTERRVIMYCSRRWGWKAYAAKLTPGTYEESAAPEGCFGVYTNSAGQRKAWMVHLAQDGEPSGFVLRVQ